MDSGDQRSDAGKWITGWADIITLLLNNGHELKNIYNDYGFTQTIEFTKAAVRREQMKFAQDIQSAALGAQGNGDAIETAIRDLMKTEWERLTHS